MDTRAGRLCEPLVPANEREVLIYPRDRKSSGCTAILAHHIPPAFGQANGRTAFQVRLFKKLASITNSWKVSMRLHTGVNRGLDKILSSVTFENKPPMNDVGRSKKEQSLTSVESCIGEERRLLSGTTVD